ncbi:MAG: hypothetical protein MUF23_09575 [Pirellula sp.]|jgi:DNA-binding NarL/FixJ family response regulator|nr:hypothetical protein [Pirellula sp.]
MTIVLFTNDLMFQSRIASVVRGMGNELIVARSVEALKDKLPAPNEPSLAVFDLSFRSLDLEATIPQLRQDYPTTRLVAYGPHVDVDRLQQAVELGIDEVMTRGQFDRDMASILDASPR